MITSPQPGAEICPDTIVTSCGIDQPGLSRTFALDQEFLDIPEDQINEFPLFALSEGQHSLEVIVFQPDPSFTSKESVVLFQHWVIFNVNQSACDRADESQKIDEDSAHDRHRFARIQMQLFLASITQLPRDQIEVPPGMLTDIIGVIHPIYVSLLPKDAREEARTTTILGFNVNAGPSEDLFEVSSVVAALWRTASRERREDFLFVDLGAAWGRQAPRVALLGQRMGVRVRTLALEAEPTHFEMSDEVYRLNGLVPNGQEHRLVFGAVGWKDGHADFLVGDAYKWWGQALSFNALNPNVESVPMFTLKTLLAHEPLADLIHFDVQGAELRSLSAAASDGTLHKVRALFIGTHSLEQHWGLLRLFCRLRWHAVAAFEPNPARGFSYRSFLHTWTAQDGVQVWLNPALVDLRSEFGRSEPVSCEGVSNTCPWRRSRTSRSGFSEPSSRG